VKPHSPPSTAQAFPLSEAMKRLGRPVVFYPFLAKLIGMEEAILLAQLVYWTPRSRNEHGWVFKSAEDLENETSLTYRQQRRVREELCTYGLLQERYSREEHRLYLRVVPEAIDRLASESQAPDETSGAHTTTGQVPHDETSQGTLRNVTSYKETETTSEITQRGSAPFDSSVGLREAPVATPEGGADQSIQRHNFFKNLRRVASEKDIRKAGPPASSAAQRHFEECIHRNAVSAAYFDFLRGGADERKAIRGAIDEAARSLLSNRSMELRDLSHEAIAVCAWERVEPQIDGLIQIGNFEPRRNQVVAVALRTVAEAALSLKRTEPAPILAHHARSAVAGGARA
jgi:hypothetical protein